MIKKYFLKIFQSAFATNNSPAIRITTQMKQKKQIPNTNSKQQQLNVPSKQQLNVPSKQQQNTASLYQQNFFPRLENNNNIYFNQQWNNPNYLMMNNNSYLNNSNRDSGYYSLMQMTAANNAFPQINNFSNPGLLV